MLLLKRGRNDRIIFDLRDLLKAARESEISDSAALIEVLPVEIRGNQVRLGIIADGKVHVHREEVYRAIERERRAGAA